jgi:hypothetical protein
MRHLLPFKVHQLLLKGRHYILLPKLNPGQMQAFVRRFEEKGWAVERAGFLTAKLRKVAIHVVPSGYCWSSHDPSDMVLPAIPEILSCPKERAPLAKIEEMYYRISNVNGQAVVHLSSRIESTSLWGELRSAGECALSPDEHAVASFMIARAKGTSRMLTDFPVAGSVPKIYGRKRFYESNLNREAALSTLRVAGMRAAESSYLRRDGILALGSVSLPTRDVRLGLIDELGEWCSYVSI